MVFMRSSAPPDVDESVNAPTELMKGGCHACCSYRWVRCIKASIEHKMAARDECVALF